MTAVPILFVILFLMSTWMRNFFSHLSSTHLTQSLWLSFIRYTPWMISKPHSLGEPDWQHLHLSTKIVGVCFKPPAHLAGRNIELYVYCSDLTWQTLLQTTTVSFYQVQYFYYSRKQWNIYFGCVFSATAKDAADAVGHQNFKKCKFLNHYMALTQETEYKYLLRIRYALKKKFKTLVWVLPAWS